tara:strand:+ start:102390 stop:102803 length:414 start_codon:yes stop_codon:yes gene_type:complete
MTNTMKILFFLLFTQAVSAKLYLNVSILVKKGVNLGITLASELQSVEEIRPEVPVIIKMKNGVIIEIQASFENIKSSSEHYGPSENILVIGKIINEKGEIIRDFSKEKILIPLNEQHLISQEKDNQKIELRIQPEIR